MSQTQSNPAQKSRTDEFRDLSSPNSQKARTEPSGQMSIPTLRTIANSLPDDDPRLPQVLGALGIALYSQCNSAGIDLTGIGEGILALKRAVDLSPEGNPNLITYLYNLGASLFLRYQHTGEPSDADDAISVFNRPIVSLADGHPNKTLYLRALGQVHMLRFSRMGTYSDVEEGASMYRKALSLTPEDHPSAPTQLRQLANAMSLRFNLTNDRSDLEGAIAHLESALKLAPGGSSIVPVLLRELGTLTAQRAAGPNVEIAAFDDAIEILQRAVALTPGGQSLSDMLVNLGTTFLGRFKRTWNVPDVAQSISCYQRVISLNEKDPVGYRNLGRAFMAYFRHTQDLSYTQMAYSSYRRAVELMSLDDPGLPHEVSLLAEVFIRRFELTREMPDIEEAVLVQQRSVDLTPDGHPELPVRLATLGYYHLEHLDKKGINIPDLQATISVLRQAVQHTPDNDEALPERLSNLAGALVMRFQHQAHPGSGSTPDLEEAISLHRRALALLPEGHVHLIGRLRMLAKSLTLRWWYDGPVSDSDEAMILYRRALEVAPEGSGSHPSLLYNMGLVLLARFERSNDSSDIEEAISSLEKAVRLFPSGYAYLSEVLYKLGEAQLLRHSSHFAKEGDLQSAVSNLRAAATNTNSPPVARYHAARMWVDILSKHFKHTHDSEIFLALDSLISLVTLIAGLSLTVRGRYAELQKLQALDLASQAAAVALRAQRGDDAVIWLERGRCLVWSQLNSLRTPLDDLRAHDETLADEIAQVARKLDTAALSSGLSNIDIPLVQARGGTSLQDEARLHISSAKRWDALLAQARALPGLENFLLPEKVLFPVMQHLPASGYVVLINVAPMRCDAVVMVLGGSRHNYVPLENLTLEKAKAWCAALKTNLQSHHVRARGEPSMRDAGNGDDLSLETEERGARIRRRIQSDDLKTVLGGLWVDVVKPIIDYIRLKKFDSTSGGAPPRIWWCPTGPLSLLPIHAAGRYTSEAPESLFDYAISSYTPTVTALVDRVRNHSQVEANHSGLLLTCQPHVPGLPSIPGTTKEVEMVHTRLLESGARVSKLDGDTVTLDEYLRHMEDFSSVHLACHASQKADDPLSSSFYFRNGTLDLQTIIQRNLKNADLAFLSACQTSTGDENLSDEAVHLAAGMLAAGYRRVVATMWSIQDTYAPDVALDFYDYLLREGRSGGFDGSRSAEALWFAINRLRGRLGNSEGDLLTWVPYVHFGY